MKKSCMHNSARIRLSIAFSWPRSNSLTLKLTNLLTTLILINGRAMPKFLPWSLGKQVFSASQCYPCMFPREKEVCLNKRCQGLPIPGIWTHSVKRRNVVQTYDYKDIGIYAEYRPSQWIYILVFFPAKCKPNQNRISYANRGKNLKRMTLAHMWQFLRIMRFNDAAIFTCRLYHRHERTKLYLLRNLSASCMVHFVSVSSITLLWIYLISHVSWPFSITTPTIHHSFTLSLSVCRS